MRVAVFTNQFPGWVNTFFARDMRAMLSAGVELDIFAFYPLDASLWGHVPKILNQDLLPAGRVHHLSLADTVRELLPGVARTWRVFASDAGRIAAAAARYGLGPVAKSLYVLPKAWAWATRFARSYDHVLAYWGNYSATCAYAFHRLSGETTPFSMFLHAGIDLYRDPVYLKQKLLRARKIIVVSEYNRRYLEERYTDIYPTVAGKIYLHHLGLDLDQYRYQPGGRVTDKVLGVGRLDRSKRFDALLCAAAMLGSRGVRIRVELIGDGPEANALKRLASKLGIAGNVSFRGWMPPDDVPKAMAGATLLAHPSEHDSVPTVIKECMAVGTPVVASRLTGTPELLDDGRCGALIPPGDAPALAGAIETLLAREDLRRGYAEAARRRAEELFDLWRNGRSLARVLSN